MKTDNEADSFLNDTVPLKTPPPVAEAARAPYKRNRRQLPASLGITDKCLPPLTRRRTAVYQLLGRDKRDMRIMGGEDPQGNPMPVPHTVEPPPFEFSPTYQFEDRGEEDFGRRRKTMVYTNDLITYTRAKQATPKELAGDDFKLDIPTFVHGQLILDCEANFIKYVFMELHPQNESNKWRDKTRRAEFKRVDIEYVSSHVALMQMDIAADAEDMIRRMDAKALTNLGAAFGMNPGLSIQDLRLELRHKARQSPKEVLFKAPDKYLANQLNLISAINMGVVDYDTAKMEYYFPDDEQPFFIVPIDTVNPLEAAAVYLATPEGKEAVEILESLISYWQ